MGTHNLKSKGYEISAWNYTYSYYDNYQGVNIELTYYYYLMGSIQSGTRTVKVHI